MFTRDATRQPRILALVISYSIPTIINLVKEHRSRVNNARAARRRAIILAIPTLLNNHLRFLSPRFSSSSIIFSFNVRKIWKLERYTQKFIYFEETPFFQTQYIFFFNDCLYESKEILNTCKYKIFCVILFVTTTHFYLPYSHADSFEIILRHNS